MKRVLLAALLTLGACKRSKASEPPPPSPPPRSGAAASPELIKRLRPAEIKAKVEGAEQQHEEWMDNRFREAQQGQ